MIHLQIEDDGVVSVEAVAQIAEELGYDAELVGTTNNQKEALSEWLYFDVDHGDETPTDAARRLVFALRDSGYTVYRREPPGSGSRKEEAVVRVAVQLREEEVTKALSCAAADGIRASGLSHGQPALATYITQMIHDRFEELNVPYMDGSRELTEDEQRVLRRPRIEQALAFYATHGRWPRLKARAEAEQPDTHELYLARFLTGLRRGRYVPVSEEEAALLKDYPLVPLGERRERNLVDLCRFAETEGRPPSASSADPEEARLGRFLTNLRNAAKGYRSLRPPTPEETDKLASVGLAVVDQTNTLPDQVRERVTRDMARPTGTHQ